MVRNGFRPSITVEGSLLRNRPNVGRTSAEIGSFFGSFPASTKVHSRGSEARSLKIWSAKNPKRPRGKAVGGWVPNPDATVRLGSVWDGLTNATRGSPECDVGVSSSVSVGSPWVDQLEILAFFWGTMGPSVRVFPFEHTLRSEPGLENRRL